MVNYFSYVTRIVRTSLNTTYTITVQSVNDGISPQSIQSAANFLKCSVKKKALKQSMKVGSVPELHLPIVGVDE